MQHQLTGETTVTILLANRFSGAVYWRRKCEHQDRRVDLDKCIYREDACPIGYPERIEGDNDFLWNAI
jgi:hypothetical protein